MDGATTKRQWVDDGRIVDICQKMKGHSPSNFTDNMPTLNPLKTVIEHDIVPRVVIPFCEEQLGRISICFLEAGVRCVS